MNANFDQISQAVTSYRVNSKSAVIDNARNSRIFNFKKYSENVDYISMVPLIQRSTVGTGGRATTRMVPLEWIQDNPKFVRYIDRELVIEPFITTV